VIGIDPGRISGIAIVTTDLQPKLLHASRCITSKKGSELAVSPFLVDAIKAASDYALYELIAVVEDQYIDKNMRTALTLAQRAGRWMEACLANGLKVERVAASSWQASELKGWKNKSTQLKKASQGKVIGIWGLNVGPDVADAALMARYRAIQIAHSKLNGTI